MKYSQIHMSRTAYCNLKQKPVRTFVMMVLVGIMAFVAVNTIIYSIGLAKGMENLAKRFGADIVVVPQGYDAGMEEILIKGEPCYFYLERFIGEQIEKMEGVDQVSEQIYLTSSGESCCDFPVQIMGFNQEDDFTIGPWIKEEYKSSVGKNELIIGSDVTLSGDNEITFYEKKYRVVARLEHTGTGLDKAVYANWDTLTDIYNTAIKKGFHFLIDEEEGYLNSKASSILIKVKEGADRDLLIQNIQASFDHIQVLQTQNVYDGIKDKISNLSIVLYLFVGLLFLLLLVILSLLFSIVMNERKRECAIYRMLGASRRWISKLFFQEAFYMSLCGAIGGVVLAVLEIVLFKDYISRIIAMPLYLPNNSQFIAIVLFVLVVVSLLGPVCCGITIHKNSKFDMFHMYKEGE